MHLCTKDACAAILSSYGNQTRLDRFIPVSTAYVLKKGKQLDAMHACVGHRCPIDQLLLHVSFQLCGVRFLFGLVFSQ